MENVAALKSEMFWRRTHNSFILVWFYLVSHLYEWWRICWSCITWVAIFLYCHFESRSTLSCCRWVLISFVYYIPLYSTQVFILFMLLWLRVSDCHLFTRLLSYSALGIVRALFPLTGTLCGRCHRLCVFLFVTEVLILLEIMICSSSFTDWCISLSLAELLSQLYCVWSLGRRHFTLVALDWEVFYLFALCVMYLLIFCSLCRFIVIIRSVSWLIASAVQHLFPTALVICLRADVLLSPVLILYFFVQEL